MIPADELISLTDLAIVADQLKTMVGDLYRTAYSMRMFVSAVFFEHALEALEEGADALAVEIAQARGDK